MSRKPLTLREVAEHLGARLVGDAAREITGIATLQEATAGDLSFLSNPVYRKYLTSTRAAAVILSPEDAEDFSGNALILDNPYAGYARLTALFVDPSAHAGGIHPTAVVAADAQLDEGVSLGPHVTVESGAQVGANTVVGPGCVIGANTRLGAGSILHAHVCIYHDCVLGERVILQSGVVIGGDGFGFAPAGEEWVKIHHLGGVRIGDDVELGANTCVDRGALGDTIIGDGVKVDNQVQIAHGVKIGAGTVMAGCSAIAGSTEIGARCLIGGGVGIVGHLTIADRVTVTAMTLVTKSISRPGSYSSGTPLLESAQWRKQAVRFGQLEEIHRRLRAAEKNR